MERYETDAKSFVPPSIVTQNSAQFLLPQGTQGQENVQNLHGSYETLQINNSAIIGQTDDQTTCSIRRFVERTQYFTEFFEYPRKGTDPGMILIFNHDYFNDKNNPPRRGSSRDVNEIILSLQRLGFNIYENNICTNFTRDEILKKLEKVASHKRDLQQANCLIVFFLTHGDDFEQLHAFDRTIKTYEIWGYFANLEELENKPKMFIFQACKGENWTVTNGENNSIVDNKPSDVVELNTYSAKHMRPDMLVVYSTIEGNVSFRHPLTGSWFIQELCNNFTAYGRRDDVLSLLTRTTKCVCGNYFNPDEHRGIQKQMPLFVSTLTRKFYLNRNKDRAILLQIQDTNNEMLRLLVDIKKQVDALVSKNEEKSSKKSRR